MFLCDIWSMYTQEFYRTCLDKLTPHGILVTQARPLSTPNCSCPSHRNRKPLTRTRKPLTRTFVAQAGPCDATTCRDVFTPVYCARP